MNCLQCKNKQNILCQKCFQTITKVKLQQITKFKESIKQTQIQTQNCFIQHTHKQKSFQPKLMIDFNQNKREQKLKVFKNQRLKKTIKQMKQKVKKVKTNIQKKLKFIEDCHRQGQIIKQGTDQMKKKARSMELLIEAKRKINYQNYKYVNAILKQIKQNLHIVLEVMHKNTQLFESNKIFQIQKTAQLDYFMPSQDLSQSIVQIQNLQTVKVKTKTNQKCLHIILKNVLCFQLITRILNIWVPYKVNVSQFKLDEATINQNKVIDFGSSKVVSQNIMQFFPSKLKNTFSQQSQEQQFQELQQFEHLSNEQFNRRTLSLNSKFMNSYQANLEYLYSKFGIQKRPLVFLHSELVQKMIKASIMRNIDQSQCEFYVKQKVSGKKNKYQSMLKQLKLYWFIQKQQTKNHLQFSSQQKYSAQEQNGNLQKQDFSKKISQFEDSNCNAYQGEPEKNNQIYSQSLLQSVYDIQDKIIVINSKDSDQFEVLQ